MLKRLFAVEQLELPSGWEGISFVFPIPVALIYYFVIGSFDKSLLCCLLMQLNLLTIGLFSEHLSFRLWFVMLVLTGLEIALATLMLPEEVLQLKLIGSLIILPVVFTAIAVIRLATRESD